MNQFSESQHKAGYPLYGRGVVSTLHVGKLEGWP